MEVRTSVEKPHQPGRRRPGETTPAAAAAPTQRETLSSSSSTESDGTDTLLPTTTGQESPSRKRLGQPLTEGPPRSKRCLDNGESHAPAAVSEPSSSPDNAAVVKRSSLPDRINIVEPSPAPENSVVVKHSYSPENDHVVKPSPALDKGAVVKDYSSPENDAVVEPSSAPDKHAIVKRSSSPDDITIVEPSSEPDKLAVVKDSSSPDDITIVEPSSAPDKLAVVKRSSSPDKLAIVKRSSSPDDITIVEPSSEPDKLSVVKDSSSPDDITIVEPSSAPDKLAIVKRSSSPDDITIAERRSSAPDKLAVVKRSSSPDKLAIVKRSSSPDKLAIVKCSFSPDDITIVESSSAPDKLAVVKDSPSPDDITIVEPSSEPDKLAIVKRSSSPDKLAIVKRSSSPDDIAIVEPSSTPDKLAVVKDSSSPDDITIAKPPSSVPDNVCVVELSSAPDNGAVAWPSSATDNVWVIKPSSSPGKVAVFKPSSTPDNIAVTKHPSSPDNVALVGCSSPPDNVTLVECSPAPDNIDVVTPSSAPADVVIVESTSAPDNVAVPWPAFTPDNVYAVEFSFSPDHIAVVEPSSAPDNVAIVEPSSALDNIVFVEPSSTPDNIVEFSFPPDNVAVVVPSFAPDNDVGTKPFSAQETIAVVELSSAADNVAVAGPSSAPDNVVVAEPSCAFDQFPPTTPISDRNSDDVEVPIVRSPTKSVLRDVRKNRNQAGTHFGSKVDLEALKHDREFNEADELQIPSQQFKWSKDYSTFRGQKSAFTHPSGPTKPTTDPLQCFLNTWDEEIIKLIVDQTNLYAAQEKAIHLRENPNGTRSQIRNFQPTTVNEIYRLLAIFVEQSVCSLGNEKEYWVPESINFQCNFSRVMSYGRFIALKRVLHFVNNERIIDPSSGDAAEHKLWKVMPIIEHCRNKFQEQYAPEQNIAIDESLMLWKGPTSFTQFIKTKAARFGIKSYELCESRTGYLYDFYIYTGKERTPAEEQTSQTRAWPTAGASVHTVLRLMENLYDKHHILYMDNYYNSPSLARYLKNRGTDCVGTLKTNCKNLPEDVTRVKVGLMDEGSVIARHCGDVSVLAWRDKKNKVMTISTFHDDSMSEKIKMQKRKVRGQTTTQTITLLKPNVILDYNKNMGGVDLKDQRLSSFLMERKQNQVWYKTLFKHLLNTSILNMYIIYCESIKIQTHAEHPHMCEADLTALISHSTLSHRKFRYTIAGKLYDMFRKDVPIPRVVNTRNRKIIKNFHGPEPIPRDANDPKFGERVRRSCVVCSNRKPTRSCTIYRCKVCLVALCVPKCFCDFHELNQLC